jgi:phosphohistidine phosphatase
MNLILMRHGLTEPRNRNHDSDAEWNLTQEGRTILNQFVPLIHPWFPIPEKMIISPALRTRQTAEILCEKLKIPQSRIVSDSLILHGSAGEIASRLSESHNPNTVWIVGHQPTLGQLLCALIGLDVFKGFHMKPGDCAFLWFSEKTDINNGRLLSYASPDLVDIVSGNR